MRETTIVSGTRAREALESACRKWRRMLVLVLQMYFTNFVFYKYIYNERFPVSGCMHNAPHNVH